MNSKKVVGLAVFWSVVFCLFSGAGFAVNGDMGGGDGSEGSPWLIEDLVDFHEFAGNSSYWDDYTRLECDPNLIGIPYTTAVIAPNGSTNFTGVFDGNGHIIYNLTIDTAGASNDYLGLFGLIDGDGSEVKNLGLENVNVTSGNDSDNLGGLCGLNREGTMSNCYSTGSISGGDSSWILGGLCGGNFSSIRNCHSTVSITENNRLGGLVGFNLGYVSNSYATGSVSGDDYLGGLCGWNYGSISNCYSIGTVTGGIGTSYHGGLCGVNDGGGIIGSCYFLDIAGPDNGLGEPLDDPNMMIQSSFVGWDFVIVWRIDEGQDYPRLQPSHEPTYLGNGTVEDPYQISTVKQLNDLGRFHPHWDKHFILTADIDLAGLQYTTAVIAPDISPYDIPYDNMFQGTSFTGVFDGNGHTISNLNIDDAGTGHDYLGLFGKIEGSGAEVKNLGLENVNITGGDRSWYLGGLCGENRYGTISNCYATGSVTGGDGSRRLGGLCGYNNEGIIRNCYATGSVTGGYNPFYLGGLCGYNNEGIISNCYSSGSVTGGDVSEYLGGLCGENFGSISDCYATSSVTGGDDSRFLGGLCGINYGSISNCYATGSVSGDDYFGGLCGYNYNGSISNCYFLDSAGPDNGYGTPLDDSNMRLQDSFVGWDFVGEEDNGTEDQWQLCIDGYDYPRLAWQFNSPADFLHPGRVDNYDLFVLTHDWLNPDSRCCDIIPSPDGDGIVNIFDYQKFSEYWLIKSLP